VRGHGFRRAVPAPFGPVRGGNPARRRLPGRPGAAGRRRGARAPAAGRAGPQPRCPGRVQPRLETGRGGARLGARGVVGQLPGRAAPGGRGGAGRHPRAGRADVRWTGCPGGAPVAVGVDGLRRGEPVLGREDRRARDPLRLRFGARAARPADAGRAVAAGAPVRADAQRSRLAARPDRAAFGRGVGGPGRPRRRRRGGAGGARRAAAAGRPRGVGGGGAAGAARPAGPVVRCRQLTRWWRRRLPGVPPGREYTGLSTGSGTRVVAMTTRPAGELPAELTSFVGRRAALAEVKRLLSRSRLVTLTGVAGVGKSRLAVRVARDVRRSFPDGVRLVDLSAVEVPERVGPLVRARLGVSGEEPLAERLAGERLLLVLDGCEFLVQACGPLVAELLAAAPQVRVLVTSQRPLGIAGEQVWPVPPMRVAREWPGRDSREALELFAERAAAVLPGFALDESNEGAVARLCQELDGLPLAIELAALWTRTLSVP